MSIDDRGKAAALPDAGGIDAGDRELTLVLRAGATRHAAPAALRRRIIGELRAQERAVAAPGWRLPWWMTLTAGVACGAVATWLALMLPLGDDRLLQTENEVLAAHARSLMAAHVTDVASSDQHAVKPWLSSRLDFSPAVPDLAGEGFPLVGGRLDYIAQRPVAALVYRRQEHVLNVFVWPASATATAQRDAMQRGLHTVSWTQDGMQFWVVTDLGSAELSAFTQKLRQRVEQERRR